jgi:NADH-quinone oxidoreductase subunit L
MSLTLPQFLTAFVVAAPLCAFAGIGLLWLFGWNPRERTLARVSAAVYSLATVATTLLIVSMLRTGASRVVVSLGSWFRVGEYDFSLVLLADRLSVPMMAMTVVLVGVIGSFSVRYLHRDAGYLRFFLLLHLFGFAALLAFLAGSLDLLVGGWELVGLTSVLLIAFFHTRRDPVENAIRVFGRYRLADLGLLTGVFVLHHVAGTASCSAIFRGDWPGQATVLNAGAAALAGVLFVIAAAGKSAQIPFSGWLPRAMEGPTPSSAIFYGAISVHLGAYLLLRIEPILRAAPAVQAFTVVTGLVTAVYATMAGRAATDAKTSLAYASMGQVGIIFAEAGMGWAWIALIHTLSHAAVRTLQFLRAPSMLHDYHRVHAAAGGHLPKTGVHYQALLPGSARLWLYRFAIDRGHLDTILDRFLIRPVLRAAGALAALEAGKSATRYGGRLYLAPAPEAHSRKPARGRNA